MSDGKEPKAGEFLINFIQEHEEEIRAMYETYGELAVDKIMDMFSGDSDAYYDAIEDMSVNELLDSASQDLKDARENKEEFKLFMSGLGQGLGLVLKTVIKTAIPIP